MGTRVHGKIYDWDSIELEGRELEIAKECRDWREIILDRIFPNRADNPPECYDEQRMWYRKNRFSGVPDCLRIRDGIGAILDYKAGPIAVTPAERNWQLAGLAVLAKHVYGIKECHVYIIQPLAGKPTSHYYDEAGLKKIQRQCIDLVRATEKPSPRLNPGESQCKYCTGKVDCPALSAKTEKLMVADSTRELSSTQFGELLKIVPMIEARCAAIKEEAISRLEADPSAISGFALRPQSARRTLKDTAKAAEVLIKEGLIDEGNLIEICSLPLGRLERAVSRFAGLDKSEATYRVADALDELVTLSTPKPKVVAK